MALLPGGTRPRFGGAPSPSLPNHGNGASGGDGASLQERIAQVAAPPPKEDKPELKADGSGLASFLLSEMEMPMDMDDADFDDEMLRLSHKVHLVLVDELGGQQFKSDDRERLRPVAQQVDERRSQRRKTAHAQTSGGAFRRSSE